MKTLVYNGWAAGPETWSLCTFEHDAVFDYLEEMDGLPDRVVAESDGVVLVGFSMGGMMALRTLVNQPDKIRGLVLVSATPCMMEHRDEGWVGMSMRRREALRLGTRLVYRGNPSPLFRAANMDRGLDYLLDTDLRADLMRLSDEPGSPLRRMPVHVFQSVRDGIVRAANADFLKRVFPQAEVTLVPGGEHVLPVTQPEAISEAVRIILVGCQRKRR